MKPKQGEPVLIILKDGSMHEGHWLKNANYREKNLQAAASRVLDIMSKARKAKGKATDKSKATNTIKKG